MNSRVIARKNRIPHRRPARLFTALAGAVALLVGLTLSSSRSAAAEPPAADAKAARALLDGAKRIVFLGDSITASGQFVAYCDAWLASTRPKQPPTIIDAGLPSETVSGLSEEGHAGGSFPRPDLAERLDRVLAATKPDLVIACYGMNCGIYQPLDEARFERYRSGMSALKAAVEKAGAKFIVVTPPIYDDQRAPLKFAYNDVLDRYSDWLIERRKDGWVVIDLHGPMIREVQKRRLADPQFTFDPDGVHPNDQGHWFIAQQLIGAFGDPQAAAAATPQEMLAVHQAPVAILPLVQQRMAVLRDAYVSAAGHKRPGVAAGLPVADADKKAADLSDQIQKLLATEQK
jgi:lysophospholipase L1-like esterase